VELLVSAKHSRQKVVEQAATPYIEYRSPFRADYLLFVGIASAELVVRMGSDKSIISAFVDPLVCC
jgi:hypothetical protein